MTEGYLLDTSVVSQFGPGKRPFSVSISTWLAENYPLFHISTVTVAELEQGVAHLRRRDDEVDRRRAAGLEHWLADTILKFGSRVLSFDTAAALGAGNLSDYALAQGKHPGFADVAIAATAKVHGLTILTRNLKHFTPLEVPCLDPFKVE